MQAQVVHQWQGHDVAASQGLDMATVRQPHPQPGSDPRHVAGEGACLACNQRSAAALPYKAIYLPAHAGLVAGMAGDHREAHQLGQAQALFLRQFVPQRQQGDERIAPCRILGDALVLGYAEGKADIHLLLAQRGGQFMRTHL